nr:DUF6157 family protein [Bradyrhizobium brasilense]
MPGAARRGAAVARRPADGCRAAIPDDRGAPYKYTSDDVVFATSAAGRVLDAKAAKKARSLARETFFSRGQACMRASPLGKRFGWGVHADAEGRIALYAVDSKRYQALAADPDIAQVRAMRSKRA